MARTSTIAVCKRIGYSSHIIATFIVINKLDLHTYLYKGQKERRREK